MRARAIVFVVLAACAATGGEPAVTAKQPGPAPAESAADPRAPACPADAGAAPLDYTQIEVGGRYFVDVEQRAGEWAPAGHVPMPMHHATRIEWSNPEKITALGAAASGRLRFTLVVLSRDIRPVPDRHAWRVVVHAEIAEICAA